MSDQLDLTTGQPALADPDQRLTPRQRIALEYIGHHAPVGSDELGAFLHEDRRARGGRGHSSEERCDFCTGEGRQMGAALRQKGLVRHRNGDGGGWYLAGNEAPKHERNDEPSAQRDELPEWL